MKRIKRKNEVKNMKKYIENERSCICYTKCDGYYIPNLILPSEKEKAQIGVWGVRHERYIRDKHKVFYINLLTSGKLNSYLFEVDTRANLLFLRLINEFSQSEKVTEELKEKSSMEWVCMMNNIRNRVTEIILSEVIYA